MCRPKKIIVTFLLSILCLFAYSQQETGIPTFWALKYSTKYQTQTVRAFDTLVNPINGSGVFIWIKTKNNASIPDIAGIQIKPAKTIYGYWRRSYSGPINVDFFGSANTSTQKTWDDYGYSQEKLDSIYGYFGAGFVLKTDRPDGTAMRVSMKLMQTPGYQSLEFNPAIYYVDRFVAFPTTITGQSTPYKYQIQGNQAQILSIGGYTGDLMGTTYPTNQTQALTLIDRHFVVENLKFIGNAVSGSDQAGLRLSAINKSVFSNIQCSNLDVGMDLQFALSTTIFNANIVNCFTTGIYGRSGTWSGADETNSQSNLLNILSCRVFESQTKYGIRVEEASNVTITDPTIEGPNSNTSWYGIYINSKGSTLVKEVKIQNVYGEVQLDSAAVYVRMGSSNIIIDRVYFRKTENVIMIEEATNGYPQAIVSNISYWEGPSRFVQRNVNPNRIYWDFYNCRINPSFNTSANIVNPANNYFSTTLAGTSIPLANNVRVIPMVQY